MTFSASILSDTPDLIVFEGNDTVIDMFEGMKIFFDSRINQPRRREPIYFPKHVAVEPYSQFPARQLFSCGSFSYCETVMVPPISRVGRYCSIARGLDVFGVRHPIEWLTSSSITYDCSRTDGYATFVAAHRDLLADGYEPDIPPNLELPAPIIGHDVWIGQHVQLARGITIGTGSVIAAGSIVTRDVPPYSIVGGVPARVIRTRFNDALAERLLESEWWTCHPATLFRLGYRDVEGFPDRLAEARAAGDVERWEPATITWKEVVETIAPRFTIRPVIGGNGEAYLSSGWWSPEGEHTCSVGGSSTIGIPAAAMIGKRQIEIDLWPSMFRPQRLRINARSALSEWSAFDGVIDKPETIRIPLDGDRATGPGGLLLQLFHPDFVKPSDRSDSADTRELSFALTEIRLVPS